MRIIFGTLLCTAIATNCLAEATIPHTFTDGSPASASEVNQNFTAAKQAINSNSAAINGLYILSTSYSTHSDYRSDGSSLSELVSTSCPVGTVLTGGGVWCDSDDANFDLTNYGVVHSSVPAGNTYMGICYADHTHYSTLKYGPPITVFAVCTVTGTSSPTNSNAQIASTQRRVTFNSDDTDRPQMDEVATEAFNKLKASLEARATVLDGQ